MTDIWTRLQRADKPIFLYGTGNGADKILNELYSLGIPVRGVFASDNFSGKSRTFRGFPVLTYGDAAKLCDDFIVLVSFGTSRREVIDNILRIRTERELYSVDVPVYGDDIFNLSFAQKYESEIRRTYDNLCDDFSRRVYKDIILFKLTGELDYLLDCQTDTNEYYDNILNFSDSEIYADIGAYNGDTVCEFLSHVNSFREIYAFEPDVKNYSKLVRNTENTAKNAGNIHCFNICISHKKGTVLFPSSGGRNSSVNDEIALRSDNNYNSVNREKFVEIPCDTLDSVLKCGEVTYIKFDVEGLESRAISGASEIIRRYKPKMLISCYHRSEDIFTIPALVSSIRDDYKVSIRHLSCIPAWETSFFFV